MYNVHTQKSPIIQNDDPDDATVVDSHRTVAPLNRDLFVGGKWKLCGLDQWFPTSGVLGPMKGLQDKLKRLQDDWKINKM